MHKLIKYMKPYAFHIFLIILLLFVQANADLALPSLMSDIVDNGIQGSGILDTIPKGMTEETYKGLYIGSNEKQRSTLKKAYTLAKANDISILERKSDFGTNRPIYVLNSNNNMDNKEIREVIETNLIEKINPETRGLSSNMKDKFLSFFVKSEYEKIGIDTEKIQMNYIFSVGSKMLGIAFIGMVSTIIVVILASRVAAGLGKDLRNKMFKKTLGFSNVEIDKFSIASLINRSTNDIQQIQLFLVMFLRLVFYAPILGIGGIIKVLNTSASMVWIIAVAIISISFIVLAIFKLAVPRFKVIQTILDKIGLVARESLTGLLVVRAFTNEKYQEDKFDDANCELTRNTMFVGKVMGTMMPAMMLVMNLITIMVVWFGARQIDLGNLEIGDMMAFIQYTMQIIMAFLLISMVSVLLPRSSVAAARVDEILSTDFSICDPENPKSFDISKRGDIEFKNVSFKYPGAEEKVLCNLSFNIRGGETVAIIGGTGSGKSTIVKLLNRFYDVTEGSITIDGVDIRDVRQSELRARIGYVPQKTYLFTGNIKSNIKFGDENMTEQDMVYAAEIAQSTEFINLKEDKYSSSIAESGSNVSGGQKQRLSIARAIAKKPDILVFDDSFSALDFKTDRKLRDEIKDKLKGITSIIVAQRINTIKDADEIIVLNKGIIAGRGKHEDLLKSCDVYKEIALSQLTKEELGHE